MLGMNRLEHYQKYHQIYEVIAILSYFLINGAVLATSVVMEAHRDGQVAGFATWEPFVWEYTSAAAWMILLLPMLIFFRQKPWQWQKPGRSLLFYLLASSVVSLFHVAMMVSFRKAIYWTLGQSYDFGDLSYELVYEYRKDLWGFCFILMLYHGYAFIRSRLLGEANLIANGEEIETADTSDRLLVKKLGKEFIIKIADIEWLESSGNYVNLHLNGRIYPLRSTLSRLVEQIADKGFCRIHRSFAVNLDTVESISPLASGDSEVKLKSGKLLNLSRRYKDEFKQKFS